MAHIAHSFWMHTQAGSYMQEHLSDDPCRQGDLSLDLEPWPKPGPGIFNAILLNPGHGSHSRPPLFRCA
jgi:hypothetical protein